MKKGEAKEGSGVIENIRQDGIRIICFGGSNTFAYELKKNYGMVMRDILLKKSPVPIFVSMAGETAALAMESREMFINNVLALDPGVIVFEFGQHERDFKVSPDKLYLTLKDMIKEIHSVDCKIILLAPTLVNDKAHLLSSKPYAQTLQSLAKETKSVFVDPSAMLKSIPTTYFRMKKDHLHWSEKGQEFIGKLLAETILKAGILPAKKR